MTPSMKRAVVVLLSGTAMSPAWQAHAQSVTVADNSRPIASDSAAPASDSAATTAADALSEAPTKGQAL